MDENEFGAAVLDCAVPLQQDLVPRQIEAANASPDFLGCYIWACAL